MDNDRRKPLCRVVATVLAVALLSGCAVGPDFKTPPAPEVTRYTAKPLPTHTASAPGVAGGTVQHFDFGSDIPAQWWTLFHAPALNQLIEDSLTANPDLQAAKAALRVARENYLASTGGLWPSASGGLQAKRQKTSGALFGRPDLPGSIYTLYEAQAQVSYAPDVFGGVRRQIERQQAGVDVQRFEVEAARLSLTSNVVVTAVQAASLAAQIKATDEVIAAYGKVVDILQRQIALGGASQATLQQVLAQKAQAQAQRSPLERQLATAQNRLAALTGRFPSQMPPLRIDLDQLTLPAELPVSLPSALVGQRPDVRAAAARLHAASAAIGVATANMLPQFTITASLGSIATHPENLFSPGGGIWAIGAGLLQPLFEGGKLLHEKRAAVAAYDQAAAQYRSTVLAAFQNVADSLRALTIDATGLKAQLAAERAARKSLEIALGQYQAGAAAYPALLQAGLTYQQARSALVQAQAARFSDTAALFQALGGGWWNRKHTNEPSGKHMAQVKQSSQAAAD